MNARLLLADITNFFRGMRPPGRASTAGCGVPSDRCWWCGRDERQPTSLRQVRGVGPLDQNPIEGSGKGLWMETPPGPMD